MMEELGARLARSSQYQGYTFTLMGQFKSHCQGRDRFLKFLAIKKNTRNSTLKSPNLNKYFVILTV